MPGPSYTGPMVNTPPDIVGLGVIAVDDMLYVDKYPPANIKVRLQERRRQGGGTVSCGLAAAAKLGSRCVALGRLGDNPESDFVRRHLGGLGVDLSPVLYDPDCGPIHTTIVVAADTGSRAIFADYNVARPLEPGELRPEWFAGAKVLLVDHFHSATVLAGVKLGRAAGLQMVSDIERDLPDLPAIRPYIDHYLVSAESALPYSGCTTPAEACQALAQSGHHRTVVVTAGEQGCYWLTRDSSQVRHLPAHAVTPVDTTGCGDVFHGVFCHGLAAGWPIERILAWSNAAAAIKATRKGGWAAVPTTQEIEHMLDSP